MEVKQGFEQRQSKSEQTRRQDIHERKHAAGLFTKQQGNQQVTK